MLSVALAPVKVLCQHLSMSAPLILASASPARRMLLERLGLPFAVVPADVDEQPHAGEAPDTLARRLAASKAATAAAGRPDAIVIGSDQVASRDGVLLGKPGTHDRAVAMLHDCSGARVRFHTAVHIIGGQRPDSIHCDLTTVEFRTLSTDDAAHYVALDAPEHCAGGFKAESLGITLFDRISSDDPTALIGLPLIAVARALRLRGFRV